MLIKTKFAASVLAAALACAAAPALAQNPPQPGPGGAGAPGGAGGGGRADFRQRMNDRMKEVMGASDDEWKILQPRIEKVQTMQRATTATRAGFTLLFGNQFGGGRGGPGGGPPTDPNAQPLPVDEKAKDLVKSLENKDAPADDLKAKLAALREARAKAKVELTKAQDELREVLTMRQESLLVTLGMLD